MRIDSAVSVEVMVLRSMRIVGWFCLISGLGLNDLQGHSNFYDEVGYVKDSQ